VLVSAPSPTQSYCRFDEVRDREGAIASTRGRVRSPALQFDQEHEHEDEDERRRRRALRLILCPDDIFVIPAIAFLCMPHFDAWAEALKGEVKVGVDW
jgi:hypothetical protein